MAGDSGLGEAGQRRVQRRARALESIGDAAQAGAEHHRDLGRGGVELLADGLGGVAHAIEQRRLQLHRATAGGPSRKAPTAASNGAGASRLARWPAPPSATKRAFGIAALMPRISSSGTT